MTATPLSRSAPITPSRVKWAGEVMRVAHREGFDWVMDNISDWSSGVDILIGYRAAHQYPLIKATNGLRSVTRTLDVEARISQRLKRFDTIIDKLAREPSMKLSTMHDIGGCRAVLNSIDDLRRVEHRLKRNRPPRRVYDYVDRPRQSGYRAVHVIVSYEDREARPRPVEVQLRTKVMHEWAIFVERLSGRLEEDLKSGRGPQPVLDFLSVAAEAMALEEEGKEVPAWLVQELTARRLLAVPFLVERS